MPLSNAERQRRFRERQRAAREAALRAADPIRVYLQGVIDFDAAHPTAQTSSLALQAADMLETLDTQDEQGDPILRWLGIKPVAESRPGNALAKDHLTRAQAHIDDGTATPASLRAGLAAVKRLIATPKAGDRVAVQQAMVRAMLGPNGGYAPDHLCEPITGTTEDM